MPDGSVPGGGGRSPMPRWVRWSLVIAAVAVLLLVAALLFGLGGQHGPGRHLSVAAGAAPGAASGTALGVLAGAVAGLLG